MAPIPRQHPAVVLRSRYKTVRALLAVLAIAFVAIVVLLMIVWNFWVGLIILVGLGFVGVALWLWLRS
jgi:hypothetical protein